MNLYRKYGVILLLVCLGCRPTQPVVVYTRNYPIKNVKADSALYQLTDSQRVVLNSTLNHVVGYTSVVLEKGKPESLLGNLVADACYAQYKAATSDTSGNVFVMLNYGGLRSALPKGEIREKNLYELMPFENRMVQLVLSGSTTARVLDYVAAKGGNPISQLTVSITKKGLWRDARIQGRVFDTTQTYILITSDYIANGGDDCTFLKQAISSTDLGIKIRDAISVYLTSVSSAQQPLTSHPEHRIQIYE